MTSMCGVPLYFSSLHEGADPWRAVPDSGIHQESHFTTQQELCHAWVCMQALTACLLLQVKHGLEVSGSELDAVLRLHEAL